MKRVRGQGDTDGGGVLMYVRRWKCVQSCDEHHLYAWTVTVIVVFGSVINSIHVYGTVCCITV